MRMRPSTSAPGAVVRRIDGQGLVGVECEGCLCVLAAVYDDTGLWYVLNERGDRSGAGTVSRGEKPVEGVNDKRRGLYDPGYTILDQEPNKTGA